MLKTMAGRTAFAAAFIGVSPWSAAMSSAETNRVKFPVNLDDLIHYAGRERGNPVTHI